MKESPAKKIKKVRPEQEELNKCRGKLIKHSLSGFVRINFSTLSITRKSTVSPAFLFD